MLSDLCLCPFTGTIMKEPVIADDGVTYERRNIFAWFRTAGQCVSPISGQPISTNLRENRALRDFIDEATGMLSETEKYAFAAPTVRIRLIVSMHWLTAMKFSDPVLPRKIPFDRDAWPMHVDNSLCVELTWNAFPTLRYMVYKEFSTIVDDVPRSNSQVISENAVQQARFYFKRSMVEHMNDTKTRQLIFALEKCVDEWWDWRKDFMRKNLDRYKANIPVKWSVFWR